MKSKVLKWGMNILLIILVVFMGCIILLKYEANHLFDDENPFSQDKRVLIDSLKYNDTSTLYWFTFDSGTFGYSCDFLSLNTNSKLVSDSNSFLYSGSISSINKLGKDSLLLKLIEKDFHLIARKPNLPFKIELENEGVYIPRPKRLYIRIK